MHTIQKEYKDRNVQLEETKTKNMEVQNKINLTMKNFINL